jgi:hypothetical protein
MKKITITIIGIIIMGIILIGTTLMSCGVTKKGKLVGQSYKKLNEKEKNDEKFLWDGWVFTEVILESGDTIHAAIDQVQLKEKLTKNDLNVEVIVDGENDDFYFIGR